MSITDFISKEVNQGSSLYEASVLALKHFEGYEIFSVSDYRIRFFKFSLLTGSYDFLSIDMFDDDHFKGKPYGEFRKYFHIKNALNMVEKTKFSKQQLRINFGY